MKTRPIEPAELGLAPALPHGFARYQPADAPGPAGPSPQQPPPPPYSPRFDDVYHAAAGAHEQARHVFLGGNDLPQRWRGRHRFVVLETGFGLGHNFLATWAAWRDDAERCERLVFVSIEKHPLRRDDLAPVLGDDGLARQLLAAWPPLTPNLHTLIFEGGRVQLLLALGDIADLLPALMAEVDAFYLDGFAPAKNPQMWEPALLQRLNRLAARDATAATWSAARTVRDALAAAGFQVERVPGFAAKRDMTRALYAPRHHPAPPAGGLLQPVSERHALVIGAGLAGASAAFGLHEQGWRSTVLDGAAEPAQGASGNPGGLFHGVLHPDDGPHARAHRAAALAAAAVLQPWITAGRLTGQADGLLRLDGRLDDAAATALLKRLGLPPDYVDWLPHSAACARSGLDLPSGGWWFPGGGWVCPPELVRLLLAEAAADVRTGCAVQRLRRNPATRCWQALDAAGRVLAEAPSVVLANGLDAGRLAASLDADDRTADAATAAEAARSAAARLPLTATRGQITVVPTAAWRGLHLPAVPVAGAGYVLALDADRLLCGATTQHHDDEAALRPADHQHNLAQAARLGAWPHTGPDAIDAAEGEHAAAPPASALTGRVGWRAVTPDRLPLIGALPDPSAVVPRRDQPRLLPRLRDAHGGVFMLAGLGSRGLTWSVLAGRLLASWVTGSPCPVESDLRDALDVARFACGSKGPPP